MEITRKQTIDIVKSRNGFIRLDDFVKATGHNPTTENMWLTLDKLRQDICPALRTDVLEGERDEAVVIVSYRRRAQHGLKDTQFPQGTLEEKPLSLMRKGVEKAKKARAERDKQVAALRAAGKNDEADALLEDDDAFIPGLVIVRKDWFGRKDAAADMKATLADIFAASDVEIMQGAEVRYCNPATGGGFLVTLWVPGDNGQ